MSNEQKEKIKLKLNSFLSKFFSWLKENWLKVLVPLLLIFVIIFAFRGCSKENSYQEMFNQYRESIDDNKKTLEQLQTLQEQERAEREAQMQQFLAEMQRIEAEYKEELGRIEQNRNKNRNKIVEDARRDPRTLTGRIRESFGIPIDE